MRGSGKNWKDWSGMLVLCASSVSCAGSSTSEAKVPPSQAQEPASDSERSEAADVPNTDIRGATFSVSLPYEAALSQGNGYADVSFKGEGHEASCRVFEQPPESFRAALAEGIAPWPAEQTFRRGVVVRQLGGHPVAHLALMRVPGDPKKVLEGLDSQSQSTIDGFEATDLSFSLSTEHFLLCRPSQPEHSDWFEKASEAFFSSIKYTGKESEPVRTTITSRSDPNAQVRSKIYGFKWWVRQQTDEGTIDQSFSFGFWGSLASAVVGKSVELTDKSGKVARVAYFSGLGGDMKADSALELLKDGRYAYSLGSAAAGFFVKGKLASPLDTERELSARMKKPGAYSFTEQKYMPYMSQSRAIPVTYSRSDKDPADKVSITMEGASSDSLLDPTGRTLSTDRASKGGVDEYRRIFDSAGYLAQQ